MLPAASLFRALRTWTISFARVNFIFTFERRDFHRVVHFYYYVNFERKFWAIFCLQTLIKTFAQKSGILKAIIFIFERCKNAKSTFHFLNRCGSVNLALTSAGVSNSNVLDMLFFYIPTHDWFKNHLKFQGRTKLAVLIRLVFLWHHFHLVQGSNQRSSL